jgi:hypothetical protein
MHYTGIGHLEKLINDLRDKMDNRKFLQKLGKSVLFGEINV